MIKAKRLGHVKLEIPDLEAGLDYYQDTMGLHLCFRDKENAYLNTQVGQLAVHLQRGPVLQCTKLSFQVSAEAELSDHTRHLSALGIKSTTRTDPRPGVGRTIEFTDPKGTVVELFSEFSFLPAKGIHGVSPLKIGHVAFIVDDAKAISEFYQKALGFRVSDWVEDYFVFMRCGADHHTLNFLRADGGARIHHVAFELKDSSHLNSSCDVLAENDLKIIWGPVRHGPGHNIATYHRRPSGEMVELFAEIDRVVDEELGYFDPRPWHEDRPQRPKIWSGTARRDVWGPPIPKNFLLND